MAETEYKNALLIFNPIAGDTRAMRILPKMIKSMTDSGYACLVFTPTGDGIGTDLVLKYGEGQDIIVCAGGDGTANEIIGGMMQLPAEKRPLLGYIPAGSTNDFGTTVGLKKTPKAAIRTVTEGVPTPIDVGCFNGRYYAYVAAFGAFTDVSYTTGQNAKNTFGMMAYIMKGLSKINEIRPVKARFVFDDETEIEDSFIFGSISNSKVLAGIIKLRPEWVDMNDGKFEVLLIKYPASAAELSKTVNSITSMEFDSEDIFRLRASKIEVTCLDDTPMNWSLDGESAKGVWQAEIQNMHSGITIMLPKKQESKTKRIQNPKAEPKTGLKAEPETGLKTGQKAETKTGLKTESEIK